MDPRRCGGLTRLFPANRAQSNPSWFNIALLSSVLTAIAGLIWTYADPASSPEHSDDPAALEDPSNYAEDPRDKPLPQTESEPGQSPRVTANVAAPTPHQSQTTLPPISHPKARVVQRSEPPRIATPVNGARLWTAQSLANSDWPPLPLRLGPATASANAVTFWLVSKNEHAMIRAPASTPAHPSTLMLNEQMMRRYGEERLVGGLPMRRITFTNPLLDGAEKKSYTLNLGSLADQGTTPVILRLRRLRPTSQQAQWLTEESQVPTQEAAATLWLASATSLPAVLPLLAGGFTLHRAEAPEAGMAYIVKGGAIIAGARLRDPTSSAWDSLRQQFNADFVYLGHHNDFLTLTDAQAKQSGSLYALVKGRLAQVNAASFNRNARAQEVARRLGSALFAAPVQIVSQR